MSLDNLIAEASAKLPPPPQGGTPDDAATLSQTPASDAGVVASAPGVSPNAGALSFLLTGARVLLCSVLDVESPKTTLADDKIKSMVDVLAPCADHYGINLGNTIQGPLGPALFTAGPLLWEAWSQLNMELKAKRATRVEEPPAPTPGAEVANG